jgi:hypothetical protein
VADQSRTGKPKTSEVITLLHHVRAYKIVRRLRQECESLNILQAKTKEAEPYSVDLDKFIVLQLGIEVIGQDSVVVNLSTRLRSALAHHTHRSSRKSTRDREAVFFSTAEKSRLRTLSTIRTPSLAWQQNFEWDTTPTVNLLDCQF